MSDKFVPYNKMSKKQKREQDRKRRGESIPVEKIVPDKHKETRDKERFEDSIES
jgi:hypothetical protein